MSSRQQTARRVSVKKDSTSLKGTKENADTIYLIQNQNQILKLKNAELQEKITGIKVQLSHYTTFLAKQEQECDFLRTQIRQCQFTDDIRLEGKKKMIQEKIQLTKGNADIMHRKIMETRQATIFQEQKIPSIKEDKRILQKELWQVRSQNTGTKVVLQNLEKQLEKNRDDNQNLVSKRKQYSPKENQLSEKIQEKLRIIKNQEGSCKLMRKKQTTKVIELLINKIQHSKKKETLIALERASLMKKIMQKRVFLLSLIRKKYLLFIKNSALQSFRKNFRPLVEEQKVKQIVERTRARKIKNKLFRIWRSQAIKKQYTTTRYFEVQNGIQKIAESVMLSNLYATFNLLKYYQIKPLHQRAVEVIDSIGSASRRRNLNLFFSSMKAAQNEYLRDQEIQDSAKEQSLLLVSSVYFGAWAKYTKDQKAMNRSLKFRYFRELKKLRALKKKRDLSEMLTITNQKINQIDSMSSSFCHMKKQTVFGLLDKLILEKAETTERNEKTQQKISNMRQEFRNNFHQYCLLRVSKTLKKGTQKAFDIWRDVNKKYNKLKLVWYLLNSKMYNDINFGFAMIQRRRFQKLKLSIADKIQSCEFSYNYLVKQNNHIKSVLDNKLHEQEKSKFVNILHRLIRQQKEIKHKYFFKFLHSGYKSWKFRKAFERVDQITQKRIKVSVVFLLRHISNISKREDKVENIADRKFFKIEYQAKKLAFGVFENIWRKNKKMKHILANIFDRNMELSVYNGFNEVKRIYVDFKFSQIQGQLDSVIQQIKDTEKQTGQTENEIEILRDRLANKQKNIFNKKAWACMNIYVRNCSNKYLNYFNRWRNKVAHQKKVLDFAGILERKTRIIMKNKMALSLIQQKGQNQVNQLRQRLEKFKKEVQESAIFYSTYAERTEQKIEQMNKQNIFHQNEGSFYEKKSDRMDDVKVQSFRRYWSKMICRFVMRDWRNHKEQFVNKWENIFNILTAWSRKDTFLLISEEMREEILRNRIKKNLSKAYSKKYRNNAGMAFKIWRLLSLNKKIEEYTGNYGEEIANYNFVCKQKEKLQKVYNDSVNFRIDNRKMRMIFDFLKKYTRRKIDNQASQRKLQNWLRLGYQKEFHQLFVPKMKEAIFKNLKADNFYNGKPEEKKKKLFYKLQEITQCKRVIDRIFINKFVFHAMYNLNECFFAKMKNYMRYVEVCKKNQKTFCIQKVIETFEKKRKNILCQNMRRWRRNQYQMMIGQQLFKRLTRKAIYNRYEGMFYAWKLESQAKGVLKYHEEEGEVKKRKVQIWRLQKFLQDFKKEKGLLLENQEGNYVMSPRFAKKKEEQDRKDKNMRYKFVSRLIMSINGYSPSIKAYNNMQMYMRLRQKYRKSAQFVLNHLRKPDLLLAFKTWKKASAQFREDFETMERKQLIKILNRQKDKMEMQYSQKLQVDESIQNQLNRYKIFAHQREKKQKICAHILMKTANKVKQKAFETWRNRNHQLRQIQSQELGEKGEERLQNLQEEIKDLEELEAEYIENNRRLREAVDQALNIADMVKRISEERDKLSQLIQEKKVTCESLVQENETLNSKLYLAQKQAMNLLIVSGERP